MENFLIAANKFALEGTVTSIEPYGSGHINRTLLVTTTTKRYILQRINTNVFADTDALMRNILLVTRHLQQRKIETLNVIFTKDNQPYVKGADCFRMYDFVENSVTFQTSESCEIFKESGRAFGEFQNHLACFEADALAEIIPNFHNTVMRFDAFLQALKNDVCGRAAQCGEEIEFVLANKNLFGQIVDALHKGEIPLRVTHNDTKLNNVLLDADTHKARAVIDLDTIMPGSMLYDFGDSIRFGASTAAEDEKDLNKVHFSLPLFEAYTEGFVGMVKHSITQNEAQMLPLGALMMTMECGMRFLTDFLQGDTYFATKYAEHNLVRCRTQFALAKQMKQNMEKMHTVVQQCL